MGPIQLIPHHGSGWAPSKRPERLRATYSKKHGVRYLFGAYDVDTDRLHGRLRAHKNAGEILAFYRQIRMRYDARLRIYLIADNLSTHKTPAVRAWADASNVELVFTPTYASFLNRIECRFWGIGEFVVTTPTPGLRRPRQSDGKPRPLPRRTAPRPTPDQGRAPPADRRLTDEFQVKQSWTTL
jgi:hypothetical protein